MKIIKLLLASCFLIYFSEVNTSCSTENNIHSELDNIETKAYTIPYEGILLKFKLDFDNSNLSVVSIGLKQFDNSKYKKEKLEYTFKELGIESFSKLNKTTTIKLYPSEPQFLKDFLFDYIIPKIKEEINELGSYLERMKNYISVKKKCNSNDWLDFINEVGIHREESSSSCIIL